jgi:hypothetical protein
VEALLAAGKDPKHPLYKAATKIQAQFRGHMVSVRCGWWHFARVFFGAAVVPQWGAQTCAHTHTHIHTHTHTHTHIHTHTPVCLLPFGKYKKVTFICRGVKPVQEGSQASGEPGADVVIILGYALFRNGSATRPLQARVTAGVQAWMHVRAFCSG